MIIATELSIGKNIRTEKNAKQIAQCNITYLNLLVLFLNRFAYNYTRDTHLYNRTFFVKIRQ